MPDSPSIRLQGVTQNNLKGIDLDLPTGSLIVVTGPSGSGKSSLAFDTIYAEGQRRYVETFSPYTRQFLDRMDKPQARSIEGIPPAIAIEQSNSVKTTRSTVGTITEINDYLKLLMARVATASCPECHRPVAPESSESIVSSLLGSLDGRRLLVTFPVTTRSDPNEEGVEPPPRSPSDFFTFLQEQGYLRIWIGGSTHRTDEPASFTELPPIVEVIQDRLEITAAERGRLTEAIEAALRLGKERVTLIDPESDPLGNGWNIIQSKTAIGSGGLFGKGWLEGSQSHLDFLPEGHTDFIIAAYSEEFGLIGVLILLVLYTVILGRSFYIAGQATDSYSRLLAGAITLSFFVYVFVNAGMVSGILPVVGVPLPFVSYGGTAVITLLSGFGMLMSIHTHRKLIG